MKARELRYRLLTSRPMRFGFHKLERLLPPAVTDLIRYSLSEWTYVSREWPAQGLLGDGWNAESVAAAQNAHWPVLVRNLAGTGPLGVSHLPSQTTREHSGDHNAMMSYGYVLARAAHNKHRLSVLDWGGGVGHYYLYSKALLPEIVVDYHCFDVPALCRLGRDLVPEARFHDNLDDIRRTRFDLVVSSSSLHYFQDWRKTARLLAECSGEYLYLARLQTVGSSPSFVVRQTPYGQGYATEFLSWFINRGELIAFTGSLGLELIREFVFAEHWNVKGAPENGEGRGFLFRRQDAD
jgi:putative methyltransferase (TIGR04325 family)